MRLRAGRIAQMPAHFIEEGCKRFRNVCNKGEVTSAVYLNHLVLVCARVNFAVPMIGWPGKREQIPLKDRFRSVFQECTIALAQSQYTW